jgi:hypothetical protein
MGDSKLFSDERRRHVNLAGLGANADHVPARAKLMRIAQFVEVQLPAELDVDFHDFQNLAGTDNRSQRSIGFPLPLPSF